VRKSDGAPFHIQNIVQGKYEMKMKLVFLLSVCCLVFSGIAKADPAEEAIVNGGGTYSEAGNGWFVICIGGRKNALGEVDIPAHCGLEKADFVAVIIINRNGPNLHSNPIDVPCEVRTQKAAVDGRQIHRLSTASQINALSKGKEFARSTMVTWPECRDDIESTSLTGFSAAYAILLTKWKAFSKARQK
jgi:hypothetical protein